MSRRFIPFAALVLPLAFAACEGSPPWGSGGGEEEAINRDVFGPTAAYDRRLVFLGPGESLPTAVIFDFAALSDSAGLRRGIRARLLDGTEWLPLMDAGWEMEPMREPWRLIPHGPLKVVVGEAGELDALIHRGDDEIRLESGSTIAEYSPDAGTQLVLRQGRLRLGGEPIPGILLDAQLARAVSPPTAAPPLDTAAPGDAGDPVDSTREEDDGAAAPADSASGDPTPAPRQGAEAILVDNSGYYAVFAASADGDMAWLHYGGRDDVRRGARLEATEWEMYEKAGLRVPTAWRISSPADGLAGELRSEAADRATLDSGPEPGVMGYVIVTGYIEDRGLRRNVYGLIRHVR
ncbi:MAG: hypothetical protein KY466_12735 [Gemmatimonadetes bacterium]|nr:hypothetical protein [Gemmatimonadota bacterium]